MTSATRVNSACAGTEPGPGVDAVADSELRGSGPAEGDAPAAGAGRCSLSGGPAAAALEDEVGRRARGEDMRGAALKRNVADRVE